MRNVDGVGARRMSERAIALKSYSGIRMPTQNRSRRGGALGKYLLLIVFVLLLAGYFIWKEGYGKIGAVDPIPRATAGYLAFIRDENGAANLLIANGVEKDPHPLTNDGAAKRTPAWSPDGKQICFSGEPGKPGPDGRTFQLFVLGEGNPKALTYGSVSKNAPQWSPDGKLIGFLSGGAIKVVQPNGEGLRQIYPAPHAGSGTEEGEHEEHEDGQETAGKRPPINTFRWSPAGLAIAAVQVFEGEYATTVGEQLWWVKNNNSANAAQGAQPAVMEPEALVLLPRYDSHKVERRPGTAAEKVSFGWYPDGIHLAVAISTREGRHGIAVYRLDDAVTPPGILFASDKFTVAAEYPAVSPDGKKVAFELWRMSSPEDRQLMGIAVLPTDGPGLRVTGKAEISKAPLVIKEGSRPQWSPDGSKLSFSRIGKSGRDIWISGADGSRQVNLTNGVGDNFDAAWSPAK